MGPAIRDHGAAVSIIANRAADVLAYRDRRDAERKAALDDLRVFPRSCRAAIGSGSPRRRGLSSGCAIRGWPRRVRAVPASTAGHAPRAARQNLYAVRWSRRILDEVARNLVNDRRATPEQAMSKAGLRSRRCEPPEPGQAARGWSEKAWIWRTWLNRWNDCGMVWPGHRYSTRPVAGKYAAV